MLQKYLLTFCNQGILSLFNFALNIALVRAWMPIDYGIFALTLVVAMTLEALQNALVNAPLSVHVPAIQRRAPRAVVEIMLSSVSFTLAVIALVGGIAFGLAVFDEAGRPLLTALGVGGFMGSQLLRAYGRSYLFAQLRPQMVAISDLTYVGLGAPAIAVVWFSPSWFEPSLVMPATVFGFLTFTNVAALLLSFSVAQVSLRLTSRRRVLRRYREAWRDSRWALTGVITVTLQSRAHALVVTAAFGEATFAALAAGAVLFGPMRMILQAWGMITRPFLARAAGRRDRREIVMTNRLSLVTVSGGYVVFVSLLYWFWDWIDAQLYAGKYEDMETIVLLWAAVSILFAGRALFSIPLQSLRMFKEVALATAYGAVISLPAVTILALTVGFQYSIAGVGMGEAVSLVYVLHAYRRSMRNLAKVEQGQDASAGGDKTKRIATVPGES